MPSDIDAPPRVAVDSAVHLRLVRRLRAEPGLCARCVDDELGMAEWLRAYGVHISAWPLAVKRSLVEREFHALAAELPPVLYRVLRARFGTDSDAFAQYFGWPRLVYDLLLRAPVDPAELVCRYDVVLQRGEAKVLELNCSSAAGGWQTDWAAPAVAHSLRLCADGEPWPVVHRRVFDRLLQHVFGAIARLPQRTSDSIALYAFVEPAQQPSFERCLQARYDALCPAAAGKGRIVLIKDMRELTFTAEADVRVRGEPVGAVLLTFPDAIEIPQATLDGLVRAYLRKRVVFPDSPMHAVLDSKLVFAAAHEAVEHGMLDAADANVVRRFLPWTARVHAVAGHDSARVSPESLYEHREQLVLKKADSFGGRHVVVGQYADRESWRQAVARCGEEPDWIAQQRCDADPLHLPRNGAGVVAHDVVWGVFGFGGRYGGTFARAAPHASSKGVVNSAGGAHEFLVFEEIT